MALIQVIQNKFCKVPGYNFLNLIKMLSDYYGYANGRKSNDEVMEYLVTIFKGNVEYLLNNIWSCFTLWAIYWPLLVAGEVHLLLIILSIYKT